VSDSICNIDHLFKQLQGEKHPPVDQWNPDISSGVNIHIKRNGDWFYQGSLIQRPAMVRLFSTVLRRDGNLYFLVTPVEKIQVTIDDAPFTAVSMDVLMDSGKQYLVFTNNVGDKTIAGKNNEIFVNYDSEADQPTPYIEVRNRLNALIVRPVYYQMAELCVERDGYYGVWSDGHFFKLAAVGES
jgi:hypothetical protein